MSVSLYYTTPFCEIGINYIFEIIQEYSFYFDTDTPSTSFHDQDITIQTY